MKTIHPALTMVVWCLLAVLLLAAGDACGINRRVIPPWLAAPKASPVPVQVPTASVYEIEWCMGVANPDRPTIRRFHADSVAWGQHWIWFIDKDSGKQTQLSSVGVVVYCSPTAFEGILEKP